MVHEDKSIATDPEVSFAMACIPETDGMQLLLDQHTLIFCLTGIEVEAVEPILSLLEHASTFIYHNLTNRQQSKDCSFPMKIILHTFDFFGANPGLDQYKAQLRDAIAECEK